MSKLQQAFGCGTCASIIPARGNTDPTTARRHEEEQLEKRIEEEAGEVKKRKCNPIEYLLLFGKIPELEQVQVMTMGDLTAEDARQLLDAGCSKRHLLRLYGANTVGGLHYRQLEDLLGGVEQEQVPAVTPNITWITPTTAGPPRISISKNNMIRINAAAIKITPSKYRKECKVRVGIDEAQDILAIQPVEKGGYVIRDEKSGALRLISRQIGDHLRKAGISLPAKFDASWDEDMQAWIGRLI